MRIAPWPVLTLSPLAQEKAAHLRRSLVASSRNGGFVDDTLVPKLVPAVESPILAEPTTTAFTTGHAMLTFSTGR